jgi:hypothetical protein
MPSPNDFTDKNEFMQVCIREVMAEGKDQGQAAAQCLSLWGTKQAARPPKIKSKLEILNDIKKMIEKNNFSMDDDTLFALYEKMGEKTVDMVNQMSRVENEKRSAITLDFNIDKNQLEKVHTIQVFPKKRIYVDKYNEWINLDSKLFSQMIINFSNPKLFRPFGDCKHERQEKYFNIMKLHQDNRGLFADIQFTARGLEAVKNEDFSYISPDWGDRMDTDKKLHKNVLTAITLTNVPAMEGDIPPIQAQIQLTKFKGGLLMKNYSLEKKLELVPVKLQAQEGIDPAVLGEILALIEEAAMKIQELTGANQEQAEEIQKFEKANKEITAELSTIKTTALEKEADEVLTQAVKDGQLPTSETYLDIMKKRYVLDKKSVVEELEALPKSGEPRQLTSSGSGKGFKLSQDDRDIMENAGLDPDDPKDIKVYKEANPDLEKLNKGGAE